MVEVFKTDVPQYGEQAKEILKGLSIFLPGYRITFDLSDCDRVLRIEGERVCPKNVIRWMQHWGYACTILD